MLQTDNLRSLYSPTLDRKNTCIVAACDDKYAFCLFAALQSLWKYSPLLAQQADIWIAGVHLSAASKRILSTIPHVRLLEYAFPGTLPDTEAITNFTAASFARYECFKLLTLYTQVLYLDSDILIRQELAPVFNQITTGLGLVPDPDITPAGRNFSRPINGFAMQTRGFNSGFMALNRGGKWHSQGAEITRWLYQQTRKQATYLIYPDQGIINLALQQFHIQPTVLVDSYNCPASRPNRELKTAPIIHATGPRKFWCYYYFDEFYTSYTCWIKQGGAAVSVRKQDSPLYKWFIQKTGLDKYIFVQLCPDFIARPHKALRFLIKKWLRCKF